MAAPPDPTARPGQTLLRQFGEGMLRSPAGSLFNVSGRIAEGVYQNPIAKFALRQSLGNVMRPYGGSPEDIDRAFETLSGVLGDPNRIGQVFQLIGQFGPDFYLGTKAINFGMGLLEKAAAASAPRIAARLAGTAGPMLDETVSAVAKRWLGAQAGGAEAFLARKASEMAVVKPGLLTAAEMGTRATVGGVYAAGRKATETDATLEDVVRDGAMGLALGTAIEVALVGGGKLLSPIIGGRFREVDPRKVLANAENKLGVKVPVMGEEGTFTNERGLAAVLQMDLSRKAGKAEAYLELNRQLQAKMREVHRANSAFGDLTPPPGNMAVSVPGREIAYRMATGTKRGTNRVTYDQLRGQEDKLIKGAAQRRFDAQRWREIWTQESSPTAVYMEEISDGWRMKKDGAAGYLNKFVNHWLKQHEDWVGQQGVAMTKFMLDARDAVAMQTQMQADGFLRVKDWTNRLLSVERATNPKAGIKDMTWARKYIGEAEYRGVEGVRRRFGDDAAKVIGEIDTYLRGNYEPLVKVGAEPMMDMTTRSQMGTPGMMFPHVRRPMDQDEFVEKLAKVLVRQGSVEGPDAVTKLERARVMAAKIVKSDRKGLRGFGSFEHQRQIPGTIDQLMADPDMGGLYVEPMEALQDYISQLSYRTAWGSKFGFNGELAKPMIEMVRREGGNADVAKTIADSVLGKNYYDESMLRLAHTFTSFQTGVKLPFAVIANMAQPGLNAVGADIGKATQAYVTTLKNLTTDRQARDAMAVITGSVEPMFQSIRRSAMQAYSLGKVSSFMDNLAIMTMKGSGFDGAERFLNRASGAITGRLQIMDDLSMAATGRLRGNNLAAADRRMAKLGLDLPKLVRDYRAAPPGTPLEAIIPEAELERGMYRFMQQFQFAKDALGRAPGWQTPGGLVATQFKGYLFNYTKMIRDEIWAEYARGNYKPLAHFLAISPVAGELVNATGDVIKGKRAPRYRNGLERFVDDVSAIGGLGIVTSAMAAAKYGRMADFVGGPTVADGLQIMSHLLNGEPGRLVDWAGKQPIAVLGRRVVESVGEAKELLDEWATASSEGHNALAPGIPLGDILATQKGKRPQ